MTLQTDAGRWRLAGALDFTTVPGLVAEAEKLFRNPALRSLAHLEIDLAAVEFANSAGLALLLEWMEMAESRDIRLVYLHLPDSLHRIAAFSNLQDLLPVVPDPDRQTVNGQD
ncbi:STAS domain-containing protein [Thiobaca trueperi]|uniref:STAS domain-containing protein n=1 Tax=Thiobaca trueperi TaxID=127458 RepID=UPI001049E578|nr:STAS domain-containing protein [Thiobaca trueperi]